MKYNISLEEALKLIIDKGVPVNLFLKENGMDDLIKSFQEKIKSQIEEILSKFKIRPVPENIQKDIQKNIKNLKKTFKNNPEFFQKLNKAIETKNQDELQRLKWEDLTKEERREVDKISNDLIDSQFLENTDLKFSFKGKIVPDRKNAIEIAKLLEQLTSLSQALEEAIETGDLYNLDLENIAKYLGAESYQEFLERRESIFDSLTKILEEQGDVIRSEEGELKLSPSSIRKIGLVALQEIFSNMKSDSASGSHTTNETGDSENITSSTKQFEFGDNISHIDFPGSIINSIIRNKTSKPSLNDLEVHVARGSAKSTTVILLDMSGSMARVNRFYNAKKMAMAMDSLIRKDYKDDKLIIIGFGSTAKVLKIPDLPSLQPYPITIYNPYIKLRFDFSKMTKEQIDNKVPLYFTNLQKGLNLARQLLSSKQINNKDIFLITDGAPTAHFKGSTLHINYPPVPSDFDEALNELKLCTEDGITINTFLMTNEWDFNYFGEQSFIQRFAKISKGRIFYPHPNELNKMVIYDFINNKKKKFSY
ncbi:MAG: VWA domain-containing protein [Leptospiraceae bacterium]|nr:VWA domain-containing protein [Leptospiraceae bacterium]